jgi:hypothetical protein
VKLKDEYYEFLSITHTNRYIQDYESTSEKSIRHSKKPLLTVEDRAQLIASSGIASYRMTYRYVHMLQELKEISAESSLDHELNGVV